MNLWVQISAKAPSLQAVIKRNPSVTGQPMRLERITNGEGVSCWSPSLTQINKHGQTFGNSITANCYIWHKYILTVQCFTCEIQCSNKWFRLISLKVKLLSKLWGLETIFWIILKSSFFLAWIRNSLNCSKIVSTAYMILWLHIIEDSPQLFNSQLISYSSFQLSDLSCFNMEL